MNNLHSIVYTVSDLGAAKSVHSSLLGSEPQTDQPYYVGSNVGGVEIGLVPQDSRKGPTAPVATPAR